jgi:hypothetical protein
MAALSPDMTKKAGKKSKLKINRGKVRKLTNDALEEAGGGRCANTQDTGILYCRCCVSPPGVGEP